MIGKLRTLLWLGVLLVFVPMLGIPNTWKNILVVIAGLLLLYLAFKLKYSYKKIKFELRKGSEEMHHE